MSYNIFYKASSYYYIMVSQLSTVVETAGVSSELSLGEEASTVTTIVESSGVSSEVDVAGAPAPAPPPEAPPEAPAPDRKWLWLGLAGLLALIVLLSRRRRRE